jgi:hypothetical protein
MKPLVIYHANCTEPVGAVGVVNHANGTGITPVLNATTGFVVTED